MLPMVAATKECDLPERLRCLLMLVQRLIFAEVGDGKAERIDLDQVVAHHLTKSKNKVRGVLHAPSRAAVYGRDKVNLVLDGSLVRRGPQVLDVDSIDLDFLDGVVARQVVVDGAAFHPARKRSVREWGIHEKKGLFEIVAKRELVAPVIKPAEIGEEVLDL